MFFKLLFLIFLWIFILPAKSFGSPIPVIWAGTSALGGLNTTPVATALIGTDTWEQVIEERLLDKTFKNLEFAVRSDAFQFEGEMATIIISSENTEIFEEITSFGSSFIHVYTIIASFLIFDWDDAGLKGRYIKSVPIVHQIIDVQKSRASMKKQEEIFTDFYTNQNLGDNFFDLIYNQSKDIYPLSDVDTFAQVDQIQFSEGVQQAFGLNNAEIEDWKASTRQFIEAQIAKYSKSALVPTFKGINSRELSYLIRDKQIKIVFPEPEGSLKFTILKLVPVNSVKDNVKTLCFMAAVKVQAIDTFGEIIMDKNFIRNGDTGACFTTGPNNEVDEAHYFSLSSLQLLKKIAEQFGNSIDTDWLKTFGVKENKIKNYSKEIFAVKSELLVSFE